MRRLGASDGTLAPYMSGQLVVGRSVRGALGPEMLAVAGRPALASSLREGAPAVLGAEDVRIAGVEEDASLACVPAVCAGEPLGMLVLVFPEPPRLSGRHAARAPADRHGARPRADARAVAGRGTGRRTLRPVRPRRSRGRPRRRGRRSRGGRGRGR